MAFEVGSWVETAHGRTHYVRAGESRRPIILLHGLGSLGQEIIEPFRRYSGGGYCFIAPDRPGYGCSEPLRADAGPRGQADWLAAFIDALGLEKPSIVAHSLGSSIALVYAAQHPDRVDDLVLLSPFCRPTAHKAMPLLRLAAAPAIGAPVCALLAALAPLIGPQRLRDAFAPLPTPAYVKDYPFDHFISTQAARAMASELKRFNADMTLARRERPQIATPVRVLCSRNDIVADMAWHGAWLCDWCADLCFLLLRDGGHLIHHTHPLAAIATIGPADAYVG